MTTGTVVACWFFDGLVELGFAHYLSWWPWWEPLLTLVSAVFFYGGTLMAVVLITAIPDRRLGYSITGGAIIATHLIGAGYRYSRDGQPVWIVGGLIAVGITAAVMHEVLRRLKQQGNGDGISTKSTT